jgi:putative tricarboxylic transport membrane protein
MRRIELATALVMLVISGMVLLESRQLAFWSDFAPGSGFMPVLVAAAGIALAVLLGLQAWRGPDRAADLPTAAAFGRVLLTMAALWAIVALTPSLGLMTPIALFVAFMLLAVARRPLGPSLITTALTVGLIWGVFVGWLAIAVPRGPFGI